MLKLWLIALIVFAVKVAEAQTTNTYTFSLNWTDTSNNEEGFTIYRDGTQIGKTGPNATSYKDTVTGTVGNPVCYEVTSYNTNAGKLQESAKSNRSCMAMPAAVVSVPTTPTGLTTSALSTTTIQLSWADNSNNETGFLLEQRSFKPDGVKLLTASADQTSYIDKALATKKTYCYRIWARNTVGDSPSSNQSCATTK
jgi:hypothetical protein